jgi:hypothetical protein
MRSLALVFAVAPVLAFGWGNDGHIQVADIAWTKLTPTAQAKIAKILAAGEPTFRPLDGNIRDAFGKSATFCDYMKGKTNTIFEDIIPGMNTKFEAGIEGTGNEGVRCKTWHYYDIPIKFTGKEPQVRPSNAYVALNYAVDSLSELQKNPNGDLRMQCWWLYWINHVVGDLHQPLHCCSAHDVHEEGDDGGNKFMIKSPDQDRKVRLHGFWDGAIGRAIGAEREAGLSPNVIDVTTRWTSDPALQPEKTQITNLNVMDWLKSGAKLAEASVYMGIKEEEQPNAKYVNEQIKLCKKQAVLSGYRLATMLNKVFN